MKKTPYTIIIFIGALALTAQAQTVQLKSAESSTSGTVTSPEWTDHNTSDPDRSVDTEEIQNNNNDASGIEHEDIGAPAPKKESGEKGGTEDINIGVGELEASQHNETNLTFIRERASAVSVSAVEVRGWDPEKKEKLLGMVREQATVRSGEDLEHFAAGALLMHEEVTSIKTDTESVSLTYTVPAKLLGVFKTHINQETTITFGDGAHGRVKVKFPWFRVFYSVDSRYHAGTLERNLLPEVDDEVLVEGDGEMSVQDQADSIGRILKEITN